LKSVNVQLRDVLAYIRTHSDVVKTRGWSHLRPLIRFLPAAPALPVYAPAPVKNSVDIAGRVRRALSARSLSLYQVSRRSAQTFGRSSPYHVPDSFYSSVGSTASPTIHQLVALSAVSGYRLSDWLAVFGFKLDDIPRLELLLPRRRTILLDSSVYDEEQWIPWFADRASRPRLPAIAPLAQILKPAQSVRARHLVALNTRRFLYAKVGTEDVSAFPDLAPGSIARIDPLDDGQLAARLGQAPSNSIFLVERGAQLHCGRVRRIRGQQVALSSAVFPFSELEFTLGRTGRILGVVDAEIRPMSTQSAPSVPVRIRAPLKTNAARPPDAIMRLGGLIQASRIRAGLSFREASALSRRVAANLGDSAYYASHGTLSDFESLSTTPRHVQKILSVCILYSIGFWDFLRAGELRLDGLGNEPMPDELCGRLAPHRFGPSEQHSLEQTQQGSQSTNFVRALLEKWKEIPLFVANALREISGLDDLSLLDVFWVGAERNPIHPHLVNASLVAVNRRLKKPIPSPPRMPSDEPVYMIIERDGGYWCGSCTAEQGTLAVHRYVERAETHVQIERRTDAEVIGRVTAILRRLL
jgi:hypothetical protein